MSSNVLVRRLIATAAGGLLVGMGVFTAGCGNNGGQAPSSTTTTTTTTTTSPTSAAPPSPTEKGINPTGGNLFTPDIKAPPAPTEPPGVHRNN